ncbi:hypothetical protein GCM10009754_57430 [Amycolatopsis minnesotensis]|uniref:Uncharacterized protein n=1 Tax=Amycolatopsis minnesotensis TaxID=337894 RepID=A0ABP5D663_9PSEU
MDSAGGVRHLLAGPLPRDRAVVRFLCGALWTVNRRKRKRGRAYNLYDCSGCAELFAEAETGEDETDRH